MNRAIKTAVAFSWLMSTWAVPCAAIAAPSGIAPHMPMAIPGDFFLCQLPLAIRALTGAPGYGSPDGSGATTKQVRQGERLQVLEARQIVIRPGIAVVRDGSFAANELGLAAGDEVYVLAEWEFDFSHAWVNGKRIGLPVQDPAYFTMLSAPQVEQWMRVRTREGVSGQFWMRIDPELAKAKATLDCLRLPTH
ncbi:MAG: hypothetical protein ACJ8GW_09705 [Massilia sp.]